jgi:hypothetical protein
MTRGRWNWLLARMNRGLRRARRGHPHPVPLPQAGEGTIAATPRALEPGLVEAGEELPRRMVEVAPGRFVNERTLKKLREVGL